MCASVLKPTVETVRLADKTFRIGATTYWFAFGVPRWGELRGVTYLNPQKPMLQVRLGTEVVLVTPAGASQ